MTHAYMVDHGLSPGIRSHLAWFTLHYLRLWDVAASNRVDHFIANSRHTARRIWRAYHRPADVIYPPVDIGRFPLREHKYDYYLFLSPLVSYKKAELVIEAFNRNGFKLIVAGGGPRLIDCQRLAGKNIEVMGPVTDAEAVDLLAGARALILPSEEDFGIVAVEAQACGTPVTAWGRGGVTETVIPADGSNWNRATGVFFQEQTVAGLHGAINQFLTWEGSFHPRVLRENAEMFSSDRFKKGDQRFYHDQILGRAALKRGTIRIFPMRAAIN